MDSRFPLAQTWKSCIFTLVLCDPLLTLFISSPRQRTGANALHSSHYQSLVNVPKLSQYWSLAIHANSKHRQTVAIHPSTDCVWTLHIHIINTLTPLPTTALNYCNMVDSITKSWKWQLAIVHFRSNFPNWQSKDDMWPCLKVQTTNQNTQNLPIGQLILTRKKLRRLPWWFQRATEPFPVAVKLYEGGSKVKFSIG